MKLEQAEAVNAAVLKPVWSEAQATLDLLSAQVQALSEAVPKSKTRETRLTAAVSALGAATAAMALFTAIMSQASVEQVKELAVGPVRDAIKANARAVSEYIQTSRDEANDVVSVEREDFETLRNVYAQREATAQANAEMDSRTNMYKEAFKRADEAGGAEIEPFGNAVRIVAPKSSDLPSLTKMPSMVS